MHSSHHIDHQTAEHQSLSRFFDRTPMILRQCQLSQPGSHDDDITEKLLHPNKFTRR